VQRVTPHSSGQTLRSEHYLLVTAQSVHNVVGTGPTQCSPFGVAQVAKRHQNRGPHAPLAQRGHLSASVLPSLLLAPHQYSQLFCPQQSDKRLRLGRENRVHAGTNERALEIGRAHCIIAVDHDSDVRSVQQEIAWRECTRVCVLTRRAALRGATVLLLPFHVRTLHCACIRPPPVGRLGGWAVLPQNILR
jgi:hypothetical protein